MTGPLHYFKRSTIILIICLGIVIAVAVWSQQYLAIRNGIVVQQTATTGGAVDSTIVTDFPMHTLLTEQVFTLQSTPKSSYAQQIVGQNKGVLTPDLPEVTVTNTQLGKSALISWYNQSSQATYDGIMIYRANDATTPGELITTVTVAQDSSYYDTTLNNNQTYYYSIQTFRNTTNSDPVVSVLSPLYPVTITDTIAPLPPQAITVDLVPDDPTVLAVRWKNDVTDEVVKNTIYRSTQAGVVGDALATVPASTTEWLDATVKLDTVYYYTVSATDDAGNESSTNLPIAPYGNAAPFIASTTAQ